jgi:gluconokinase
VIILIMGVTGAGKTTVGRRLAEALGFQFSDADDFHSPANVDKMRRGIPLEDADRAAWLNALAAAIDEWLRDNANVVLACSALKASYRAILLRDPSCMRVVYLKVSRETARERLRRRPGHFMNPALVDSQFETLEEPADAITVDAGEPPTAVIRRVRSALAL